jgi:CheY-specific phosphatase CheX
MNTESWARLDTMLEHAVEGLFSSINVSTQIAAAREVVHVRDYAGIIGFGGDSKGTLAIVAKHEVLQKLYPIQESASAEALADWLGELTNQLLGRLKNLLLRHGLTIALGTPVIARGGEIWSPAQKEPRMYTVLSSAGTLTLFLEWIAADRVEIQEAQAESSIADEGELMLF